MTQKLNKARFADGAIMLAIVALVLWAVLGSNETQLDALVGQPAPPFKLKTQSGAVVGTPDHAGKLVLLDFWATWCDPCFRQMPALQELGAKRSEDLVILAVNVDDPSVGRGKAMEKFLNSARVDVDSLIDDGSVSAMYRVQSIPALVLIDGKGVVRYASTGVHTARELNKRVDAVIGDGQ